MKHCCRNCHFLTKYTSVYGTHTWDRKDRALCRPIGNRNIDEVSEENRLHFRITTVGCYYKENWERPYNELANGSSRYSLKEKILRNRKGQCDFIEYPAGHTFPEAEERYRRKEARRDRKRNLRLTVAGLVIGVLGILIGWHSLNG